MFCIAGNGKLKKGFHGVCIATGLQVLKAMVEANQEVLCGPKGRHQVERPAWCGCSVDSQVTLGGRQVELPRLPGAERRRRSPPGELPMGAATDSLNEHTLAAVAAGVSTRRYASRLDPVPTDLTERATSKQRRCRSGSWRCRHKRLQAFLDGPLGELDLRVVCIDGNDQSGRRGDDFATGIHLIEALELSKQPRPLHCAVRTHAAICEADNRRPGPFVVVRAYVSRVAVCSSRCAGVQLSTGHDGDALGWSRSVGTTRGTALRSLGPCACPTLHESAAGVRSEASPTVGRR